MWKQGAIGVKDSNGRMVSVTFWVKQYEEPSEEYGIRRGVISRSLLFLTSGRTTGLYSISEASIRDLMYG